LTLNIVVLISLAGEPGSGGGVHLLEEVCFFVVDASLARPELGPGAEHVADAVVGAAIAHRLAVGSLIRRSPPVRVNQLFRHDPLPVLGSLLLALLLSLSLSLKLFFARTFHNGLELMILSLLMLGPVNVADIKLAGGALNVSTSQCEAGTISLRCLWPFRVLISVVLSYVTTFVNEITSYNFTASVLSLCANRLT
jgi:hypothetical protein